MFSFISFRRNINYLLPRLLNFWKPDTLPRNTNCYDVHAYMPQHQYLAFFVYIITVYTSLYYILKHKISKRNNIYVCDGKHRPEHFLFIRRKKIREIKAAIHMYIKWLNTTKENLILTLFFWYNYHFSKPCSFCACLLASHVQNHKYVLNAYVPKR